MRFVGYRVGKKTFGCSKEEKERAKKYAKENGGKVETWSYKI